jgi:uncharacterized membrane protein
LFGSHAAKVESYESCILDWAGLLLRWLHVITAIAWVGSSFYFVFLDSSLTPPVDDDLKKQGVNGELWAVHGGGFYHPVKFNVSSQDAGSPALVLLGKLHHVAVRFALLTVSYLWNANIYLVTPGDPNAMSTGAAVASALASWWFSGCCMTSSAAPSARRRMATPPSVPWFWFWCVSQPTWPATSSPARRPSC